MSMPLTTIIEEHETFRKACEIINEKLSTIFRHANISAVEIMSLWRKLYNLPQIGGYVSSAVTFQPVKIVAPGGMKVETKWYGNGASGQPLYFTVMDGDGTGALKFYYEYRPHEISLETVKKLHAYMLKALEAGIKNDEITIGELLNIE